MNPICFFCTKEIGPDDEVNLHHPTYKSNGGKVVAPAHKSCHVSHHSTSGDFRAFGRIGGQITATTKRWAFNLRNVRTHPSHEINRAFYTAYYSH